MRVQDWMTSDVLVVAPTTPAAECRQRMRECGIRSLPVVDDEALVGRVTDVAAFGRHPGGATAADLMSPAPLLAHPDDLLRDVLTNASWGMQDAVFVIDRGRIVGVLTEHDAVVRARTLLPEHLGVREVASTSPVLVDADSPVDDAAREMRRRFIRHVVVTERGAGAQEPLLVGVLSMRDVLLHRDLEGRTPGLVRALLRGPVVWTIGWNATAAEAAGVLVDHQVGCVPVVPADAPREVQGVVCRSDLLRALIRWGALDDAARTAGRAP